MLTLTTLGSLEASTTGTDGDTRSLARGKPVALLAYLACIPGHKASREHLSALLWGDIESDAARQNLRQAIWYLKKKLGDGLLEGSGEMLALSTAFTCDRDQFLQAAHRADFVAAVGCHAGAFIPDFAAPGAAEFERWCELERRRLTVTFLRCADALSRQWLGEGKFRDAQDLARRARDVDPMEQSTWRLLLEALVAGSDGLGAASEAEHFEAFLSREEQEPDAASLAAIRTARRAPAPLTPTATGPAAAIAAELVGREHEFSRVLAAWELARGGSPRALLVSAAAGMGKSRLLRDVQARLRASRSRCVLVRANPGDRQLSGGFLAEVASQLAALPGAAAVSTGTAGVLVSLAPALASTYASATPDRSDGEEAVRRRALALVDLARAVSEEQPVALLLDDLHWADDHSARVLAGALSRVEHARLLTVMAKRPLADPRALFAALERIELPPLDLAAVTAFVSQVAQLPAAPWAELLPQQLLLATGGSPLLLVETLHHALEQGWLACSALGEWHCDDPARVTTMLHGGSALRQRLLRLAPSARRVLLVLAVLGRPSALAELLAMTTDEAGACEEEIGTLEHGGFLARHGTSVVVAHDEIADAAMDAAAADERAAAHRGVARHLLERDGDENTLRRAAAHAVAGGDDALLSVAWRRFLELRRSGRDRRSSRLLAADLLRMEPEARPVEVLVRATPFWRRRRTRWIVAAAVPVIAALGAVFPMVSGPRSTMLAEVAVWTVDSATGSGRLVGVRIDPNEPWEAGHPLEAEELDSMEFPRMPRGVNPPLFLAPDGRTWWGNAKLDVVGDEGIVFGATGTVHLPLRWEGDDGIASFSPDGRQIAATTARYDTITDHLQLVRIAPTGGDLLRLTRSPESDLSGAWRPDGTQIVTQRHYYLRKSADQACLVDVDGLHERCLDFTVGGDAHLAGWLDERRLLVQTITGTLHALDAETGQVEVFPGIFGSVVNESGEFRVCLCRVSPDDETSLYLFPASNPAAARPLLFRGRPLRGAVRYIAVPHPQREWLDTLRLRLPVGGLAVDLVHRLRAEGRRANGAPAWLHDVRWLARDTAVATIDSSGRLRPKRLGSTWIVVSAGGWRVDSALARITPPSSRTQLTESWHADWTQRWQAFGTPAAIVVQTNRGPALLPNGDGSYPSGAYALRTFAAGEGAGFEADVSAPVTRTQWQTLSIDLQSAVALAALQTWDQRTGPGPAIDAPACRVALPGNEGAVGLDYLLLRSGSQHIRLPAPSGLYGGTWHRIRLQLLADGRCALAIDGQPVGILGAPTSSLPTAVFPYITGHDRFDGRLVVGKFEAWSGVRGGVDWTVLDAALLAKKP